MIKPTYSFSFKCEHVGLHCKKKMINLKRLITRRYLLNIYTLKISIVLFSQRANNKLF